MLIAVARGGTNSVLLHMTHFRWRGELAELTRERELRLAPNGLEVEGRGVALARVRESVGLG